VASPYAELLDSYPSAGVEPMVYSCLLRDILTWHFLRFANDIDGVGLPRIVGLILNQVRYAHIMLGPCTAGASRVIG
jgi:hypothetical protein